VVKEKIKKWLGVIGSADLKVIVNLQKQIDQLENEVMSVDSSLLMLTREVNRIARGKALADLQKAAMDYAKEQLTEESK